MATETTDLTIELLKRIQADLNVLRQDVRANQQNFVDVAPVMQRLDARVSDVEADLETMFKMELIGQLTNFETRIGAQLDEKLAPIIDHLGQPPGR
jgi:hypothetical protein